MKKNKFKIGDKVRLLENDKLMTSEKMVAKIYGIDIEEGHMVFIDTNPEWLGAIGVVTGVSGPEEYPNGLIYSYSVDFQDVYKTAWFKEPHIEKI